VIGVIDETTPFVGSGICYGVISGAVLADEADARAAIEAVIPPDRRRPFHWCREGPTARARMIEALNQVGVVAGAVVVQCGRRDQEAARVVALEATMHRLIGDGCAQILIEARNPVQDDRDRALILDVLRAYRSHDVVYEWRQKSDELLWIADAIGGAVHDHLVGAGDGWFDQVAKTTGLVVEYRTLPARST
jgi:hypothetical protein